MTENERHAVAHAKYQCDQASPDNPDVCFDYQLVQTLLSLIAAQPASPLRGRAALAPRLLERADSWIKDNGRDDVYTCNLINDLSSLVRSFSASPPEQPASVPVMDVPQVFRATQPASPLRGRDRDLIALDAAHQIEALPNNLHEAQKTARIQLIVLDAMASCDCGVMCQDLGKEAGCRYMQAEPHPPEQPAADKDRHLTANEKLDRARALGQARALSFTDGTKP